MDSESFSFSSDFRQRDRKLPEIRIPLDGLLWNPDCWGLQLRTRLNSDEYDDVLSETIGGRCMHWSHMFFAQLIYGRVRILLAGAGDGLRIVYIFI